MLYHQRHCKIGNIVLAPPRGRDELVTTAQGLCESSLILVHGFSQPSLEWLLRVRALLKVYPIGHPLQRIRENETQNKNADGGTGLNRETETNAGPQLS